MLMLELFQIMEKICIMDMGVAQFSLKKILVGLLKNVLSCVFVIKYLAVFIVFEAC